jgi:chemotaxis protein CheC
MDRHNELKQWKDALGDYSDSALKKAAQALSRLTGETVTVENVSIKIINPDEAFRTIQGEAESLTVIRHAIDGKIAGNILLLISTDQTDVLIGHVMKQGALGCVDDEVRDSVLGELGNVVSSSYITVIGDSFSILLLPTVPETLSVQGPDDIETLLGEGEHAYNYALMLANDFFVGDDRVRIYFLFLISRGSGELFSGEFS